MTERIFIARHGFRSNFLPLSERTAYFSPTGVARDHPLTAHGLDQAAELASHIASLPESQRPEWILSSAYYRCVKTAEPVARLLDLDIWVEEGIGEWYLPCRHGLHPQPLAATQLKSFVPAINDTNYSSLLRPSRKGESQDMIYHRVTCFLSLLFTYIGSLPLESRPKTILLVTHAATNIALGRVLTGRLDHDIRTGCCSLGEYTLQSGQPLDVSNWDQIRNGDCSFLTNGEERNWAFSFVEAYEEAGKDPDDGLHRHDFTINPFSDPRNPHSISDVNVVTAKSYDAKM